MGYCIEHLPQRISIGRETETGVTDIRIDCTDWLERWPGMAVAAIFCPPGGTPYILNTEMICNSLVWHVRDTDTATPGIGQLELTGEADGKRKLSALVDVQVARRLPSTAGDTPAPAQPWVDSVLGAAERITGMQVQATTLDAGSEATSEWNGEQGLLTIGVPKGNDGKDGADGKDAVVDATLTQIGQAADAKVTGEAVSQLKDDIDSKPQFGDPYDGVDLTVKHSNEIDGYASPWAWIKARIAAGNFSQLHVGDYIPFTTTNGRTFQAQIAGINTYKGYGDSEVGNHIDFITRELWPDAFQMNQVNFNNGTSNDKQVPWLASNGYLFVNSLAGQVPNSTTKPLEMTDVDYTSGGIYFYLPDDLKAVIIEKRIYAQTRFSDSGILTNYNSGAWVNAGKLWLPDEYEVMGARLMTTTGWFCGGYVQYPIFAHSMNRLKRSNGSRDYWWLSSALGGNSTYFVYVNGSGNVGGYNAGGYSRAPLCFRVS